MSTRLLVVEAQKKETIGLKIGAKNAALYTSFPRMGISF